MSAGACFHYRGTKGYQLETFFYLKTFFLVGVFWLGFGFLILFFVNSAEITPTSTLCSPGVLIAK